MAYLDIDNLYKNQDIFLFRECYALEKIHGTSTHISWTRVVTVPAVGHQLRFFAGGCKHADFVALFDAAVLRDRFVALGHEKVVVFGEAYGGKMQGMSDTYGKQLRFVAFEVKIGESWLAVPDAEDVAQQLGFGFVHYKKIPATLEAIEAERDAPSVQAERNGIEGTKMREGVVLRPLIELRKNNGDRIVAKHKAEKFRETKTPRPVDAEKLAVLKEVEGIAAEWVTEMRMSHVLDAFGPDVGMEQTAAVIRAMIGDVEKESIGEVEMSKAARTAIGRRTAGMLKARLQSRLAARGGD